MSTPACSNAKDRTRAACSWSTAYHVELPGPWQQLTLENRKFSSWPPVQTPRRLRYIWGAVMPLTPCRAKRKQSLADCQSIHGGSVRRRCASSASMTPTMSTFAANSMWPTSALGFSPRPRFFLGVAARRPNGDGSGAAGSAGTRPEATSSAMRSM